MQAINFRNLLLVGASMLSSRDVEDGTEYLSKMCYPLMSNLTRLEGLDPSVGFYPSLANSPFPCEQENYIDWICAANGTTEIDFLAEQQCYCNGAFFDAVMGCNFCMIAHGRWSDRPAAEVSSTVISNVAEFSSSQCRSTMGLFTGSDYSGGGKPTPKPLGVDKFPNDTAVSNYFTPTRSFTLGEITGSATARATTRYYDEIEETHILKSSTSKTNPASSTTPTGVGSGDDGSTSSTASAGGGSITSLSSSRSATGNVAGKSEVQIAGGMLVAVLGIAAFL